ncbi:MAG: PadR family transcriptional regulator [Candidatus Helarchaeota archaeon]
MFWFGRGIARQFLDRDKRKASPTEYLILSILNNYGNKSGPDIIKILSSQFMNIWTPKAGTIYPILNKLEYRQFIKSRGNYPKIYSITEKGKEQINFLASIFTNEIDFFKKFANLVCGHQYIPGLDRLLQTNLENYKKWLKNELKTVNEILKLKKSQADNDDTDDIKEDYEIPIK